MNKLEQKAWYRAVKVLYIGAYIIVIGAAILLLNSGGVCGGHWDAVQANHWIQDPCSFFAWIYTLGGIFIVFEIVKGVFFYIATGRSNGKS